MNHLHVKENKFGKGVFAKKNLRKGEHIHYLTGKIIDLREFNSIRTSNRAITVDPLQISKNKYIYLDKPSVYFNHSCTPNAGVRGKNELFAIKLIKKGQEIFYDYCTTIDEGLDCRCNSKIVGAK